MVFCACQCHKQWMVMIYYINKIIQTEYRDLYDSMYQYSLTILPECAQFACFLHDLMSWSSSLGVQRSVSNGKPSTEAYAVP